MEETNEIVIAPTKNQSATLGKLFEALAKAQAQMSGAKKGAENPFFKSKYADLHQVWEAVREPLSSNGLAVIQTTGEVDDKLFVFTIIGHSSGEWMRSETPVKLMKPDPQAMGSAITYARRYALAAICGIAQMDDDAESAMQRADHKPTAENVKVPQKVIKEFVEQATTCIEGADAQGLKQLFSEFDADEKVVLWNKFNSQQRNLMKELMAE